MNDNFSKFDLRGKMALVTGGGTGIGYFMARGLARCGAKVMIAARRGDKLKEAAAQLAKESSGNEVLHHVVDLADRKSIQGLVDHANATLGGVDILIGNAGLNLAEPLEAITDATMDEMFQVNIAANVAWFRSFVPHMRAKKWGRAIFISSVGALRGTPLDGTSIYNVCKAGLDALVRSTATEVGRDGITVNSIIPGTFKTDMLRDASDLMDKTYGPGQGAAFFEAFTSMTALGRMAECEEMEGLIQLLASDAGSYITGQSIANDGGLSIMMRPYK